MSNLQKILLQQFFKKKLHYCKEHYRYKWYATKN